MTDSTKQALLFMPDISGFTQFVNNTDIIHSQHIIKELLEILIDSNELGLEVNNVEGDAILFFKPGPRPSLGDLLKQVQNMYHKFHQHLLLYDHQRICQCGACRSAVDLKLKIIAHYGEIAEYSLKNQKQLFGKDVIVIHRLLKNTVDANEYVLLTSPLTGDPGSNHQHGWYERREGSDSYDTGEVIYDYAMLGPLRETVPAPVFPHSEMAAKMDVSFTEQGMIDADIEKVFGAIFDLDQRSGWMDGVTAVEYQGHDKINRIGTAHQCIVNPKHNPVIITESVKQEKEKMELVEMNKNGMGGCRFKMEKKGAGKTQLIIEVIVNKNPFVKLMFGLLMKNKFRKSIQQTMANLKRYCGAPAPFLEESKIGSDRKFNLL